MRLKTILFVSMALMFLTISLFTVAFSKSVWTKETKLMHEEESPQTTQATAGDSTLNQKELNKASDFSDAKTEGNVARSWSPNIFPFVSFVKDISTHKTDMWRDFAEVDEDSAELVIGVNNAQPDSYVKISDLIVENGGKLVNTVSAKGEVIAVVADLPLDLVPSFTEDVQASNLARYIEPNMKYQTQLVPNDPYWSLQWGPQKIEADYAWNTTIGDSSVLVAVIDTGIDYDHPDLAANYVALGYDWVNNNNDPIDDNGHGTHCAGIVAAELNNGIGIAGLAQVQIMAEKGLDLYGSGWEDDLADAIYHAVDQGADILSNSWGGYGESMLIYDAVKYAYDNGVLVVAAAGNDAISQKLYPAAYDEVIAVTATDSFDDPAFFTNFGEWVEVAAPGVDVYSTMPTYNVTLNDPPWSKNLNYDYLSGTSMSTPHVSGVAALIWSQFPNVTRDWVRAQLRYTADDLGDPGFDDYYGYGRINARKAVEQAPPDHDLLIFDWERPPYVKLGELAILNTTVLNFGISGETNVEVQLIVNSSLVDSTSIPSLPGGTSTTVGLSWTPTAEGTYNVTSYVVPVPDETITQNNVITEIVTVVAPPPDTTWILLATDPDEGVGTNLKAIYGQLYSDIIFFKVEHHWPWTTINDIDTAILIDADQDSSTGLPDGFYPGQNTGIGADYLIVVGWEATEMWKWDPIGGFWDVGNPISLAYLDAPDGSNMFVVGVFLASVETAGTLDCAVGDIPSDWDWMPDAGYFTWLLIRYEHELTVFLETPQRLQPSETSLLNATVYNVGLNNETNVELQLLIDGSIVDSIVIPELVNGSSYTLSYLWTPLTEEIYNVTAYAPPVPEEEFEYNNKVTRFVTVAYPLIRPIEGQWANYTMNYYDATGRIIGTGYWNFTYDHYVEPYLIYVTLQYADPYGYPYTGWMIVNIMNRMVEGGMWAGLWYPGWIETDITLGSIINLMEGTATVNGSKIIPVNIYPIDCWELPVWMYGYPYTFWYDKMSGLWISMEFIDPYYNQRSELLLVDTNIPIGTTYGHELAVSLEAPYFLEPDNSSLLNATVYNLGLNNETNVELQLLINGTPVDSVTIPELLNGTSYTISYLWTPVVEATYNVTAYALPVLGEDITINNVATRLVNVRTVKGYVLFDQTHWTDSIFYYNIWVTDLIDRGYIVDTLTTSSITQPMLEDYDVFVIPQAHDYYSSDELSVIQDFVLDGGGLLVIGDDAPYIYTDLTSFAGITWDWGGYWGYTSDITPHPVTEGVTTAYFGSPGLVHVASPAQDIIRDNYRNVMLAVSEVGLGAVIGIADEDSINDFNIDYADNRRLANNMIDWLKSRRPVASLTYSPLDPYVGETVTFDASDSYDPDGTILSHIWDFGDDSSGEGNVTNHIYVARGTYTVTLMVIDNENLNSTSTTEITVSRTTIDIQVKVGSIHFRGEIAEFYILVSSLGKPINASLSATLYFNGSSYESLTASVAYISLGFYRIPYMIPVNAPAGTYVLLVEAKYLSLEGVFLESFTLSPTLTGWNVLLIGINGTVGTIKTDVGLIEVKLEDINATIVDIQDDLVTVNSTLGQIQVDLDYVSLNLTSIQGSIAEGVAIITGAITDAEGNILTELGQVEVKLDAINATLTSIEGRSATIETDIGTIEGTITSIQGDIATIETDIGTIETILEGWTGGATSSIITPEGTFQILVLTTSALEGPVEFSENVVAITLSGPSGTEGTTNVVMPKQLLAGVESSIDKVAVTIDDEQVVFTYTEQPEAYVLTMTYTHSTHTMKIYLAGLPPTAVSWVLYVIATVIIVLTVSASLAVYILKIRKPRLAKTK